MSDEKKSPKTAEEQDAPQQVRPTNTQEEVGQGGPEDKPSQAEGERDKAGR